MESVAAVATGVVAVLAVAFVPVVAALMAVPAAAPVVAADVAATVGMVVTVDWSRHLTFDVFWQAAC